MYTNFKPCVGLSKSGIYLFIYLFYKQSSKLFCCLIHSLTFLEDDGGVGGGGGGDFPMAINNVSHYFCYEKMHLHFRHRVSDGSMLGELQ